MILRCLLFLCFGAACFAELPLMPWPQQVQPGGGALPITTQFSVSIAGSGARDARVAAAVNRLFPRLSKQTGMPVWPHVVPGNGTLEIVVESSDHKPPQRLGDDEQYSLQVNSDRARLSADRPLGVVRGIETFLQLVSQTAAPGAPGFSVPAVTITDSPRFPWRGLSLDVSRHFIPFEEVERTIDGLSAVKMNVLHWHLSDDQGFRIESRKYPRLQKYGSDGMYYTQSEVKAVISYAWERGVRIVPEFDMPGHATSWLVGYPALGAGSGHYQITRGSGILPDLMDPTKESTYRFLDGFIGEMARLFPDDYFHIGGDEVNAKQWRENPRIVAFMKKHHIADAKALQVYFNQRLLKIVTKHHKHMEGWDEVLQPSLPKSIVIQSWRGQESLWQAAREGYDGILSAGYYLDLMQPASQHYAIDPMKDPKTGAPADLTPEQAKHILGGEAAMWEELATPENLDAKLWPRAAAIAERLWSPESVTDVHSMYARLETTDTWLEYLGLQQRAALELMRERLAAPEPAHDLDVFASILEPVKGYKRHAERYSILTPFNRLVDSIPPESNAARQFNDAAKTNPKDPMLRQQLTLWLNNARKVRPLLQRNSLLIETLPIEDDIERTCTTGLAALDAAEQNKPFTGDLEPTQPHADMLLQIEPGVRTIIEAAKQD